MKKKTLDHYFSAAKQTKPSITLREVKTLVQNAPPPSIHTNLKWFNLNTFIMVSTILTSLTAAYLLLGGDAASTKFEARNNQPVVYSAPTWALTPTPILTIDHPRVASQTANQPVRKPMELLNQSSTETIASVSQPNKKELALMGEPLPEIPAIAWVEETEENEFLDDEASEVSETLIEGETKTISKEVKLDGAKWLVISNQHGSIDIQTWDQPTIKMEAIITLEGKNEEMVSELLQKMDLNLVQNGDQIQIENPYKDQLGCNCSSTTIMGIKKRKKVDNIKIEKYQIRYTLTVPNYLSLNIKNNYAKTTIDPIKGDLVFYGFKGDLTAGSIGGKADLTLKYSNNTIGNTQSAKVVSFHGDLKMGNTQKLDLVAKYCKVYAGNIQELDLEAFQGDLYVDGTVEKANAVLKYGDLTISKNTDELKLEGFQANVKTGNINEFFVEASYTDIKTGNIGNANLKKAFQSDLNAEEVNSLKASLSYSDVTLSNLHQSADLEGFNGKIKIGSVSSSVSSVNVVGKYTNIDLAFEDGANYKLNAETIYAGLQLPGNIDIEFEEEINTRKKVRGVVNPPLTENATLVSIDSFQGKVSLR